MYIPISSNNELLNKQKEIIHKTRRNKKLLIIQCIDITDK